MNYKIIIYILLNYMIAISTLLYSIIKRTDIISFLQNFLLFMVSFNLIGFFVNLLIKTLKIDKEDKNFEMDISISEQEARDLIKDLENSESDESNKSENIDEDEQDYEEIDSENDQEIEE